MELKYVLKIFTVFVILYAIIMFVNITGLHKYYEPTTSKKLLEVVTVEGLDTNKNENSLILSGSKAFCATNKGYNLDQQCNKLIKGGCNDTSCCVWTHENKCVAGGKNGPTFSSSNHINTESDYYYYQNKCYGIGCSKV
jgi:hypothetical protein